MVIVLLHKASLRQGYAAPAVAAIDAGLALCEKVVNGEGILRLWKVEVYDHCALSEKL